MNKSGSGVGSASIVLVFAVLCLTIFALITYTSARANKALTEVEARTIKEYYEADTLAEHILAEILAMEVMPDIVLGVDINGYFDFDTGAEVAEFSCPISDKNELYVKIAMRPDSYDILSWRMRNVGDWQSDDSLNVWTGFDDTGENLPVWDGE